MPMRSAKATARPYVLGQNRFAAITAVEGLKLSRDAEARLQPGAPSIALLSHAMSGHSRPARTALLQPAPKDRVPHPLQPHRKGWDVRAPKQTRLPRNPHISLAFPQHQWQPNKASGAAR